MHVQKSKCLPCILEFVQSLFVQLMWSYLHSLLAVHEAHLKIVCCPATQFELNKKNGSQQTMAKDKQSHTNIRHTEE